MKRITHEEFVERLHNVSPNLIPVSKYTGMSNTVTCRCLECEHEWEPIAGNLMMGSGCPICARIQRASNRHKAAVTKYNLAVYFPKIAAEWDYNANEGICPEDFSAGCDTEVWWICPIGHHYSMPICRRTQKRSPQGCPICNRRNQTSFPEQAFFYYLKQLFPDAVNRYSDELGRMELDIYLPSIKTAIEYDGKAWHATDAKSICREQIKYARCKELGITLIRISEKSDESHLKSVCDFYFVSSYPSLRYVGLDKCISALLMYLGHNSCVNTKRDSNAISAQYLTELTTGSLSALYPSIADEWDYKANAPLKPEMFSPGSQDIVSWICPAGHRYFAKIADRVYGHGCAECSGLKRKTTESFIEEMATGNPGIEVLGDYQGNKVGIHCRCRICSHEWFPIPNDILRGHGCPKCANTKRSAYKKEYHRTKNTRGKKLV